MRAGESWRKIGGVIGAAGIVVVASTTPGILIALAPFFSRKIGFNLAATYRQLRYAKKNQWFKVIERTDGIFIQLTEKGSQSWQVANLENPILPQRWDGQWRIVIFDVPDKKKAAREALRRTLRILGFVQLQESVWVIPFDCRKEIETVKQIYGLGEDLRLIVAAAVDGEEVLRERFGLTAR